LARTIDLRSIVLSLLSKGLSANDIHFDILHSVGPNVVGYSTITLYLREARSATVADPETAPDHDHKSDDSD
jgi:hypothetical protein